MTIDEAAGPVDTLIAVGDGGVDAACEDRRLVAWFSRTARRTASVRSGAFLLGAAGLLDGRRAVTHWSRCGGLAERYPEATVHADRIFVRDGEIWTSPWPWSRTTTGPRSPAPSPAGW